MVWLKLLTYLIVAYNISFWLVYKNGPFGLFQRFRDIVAWFSRSFAEVFNCMNCTPTWVGLFLSSANALFAPEMAMTPVRLAFGADLLPWYVIVAFDAVFTSGAVFLIDVLETKFEQNGTGE